VYGVVSLCVVAVSIISFLAESLPSFRETETLYEVKSLFNVTLNSTITSTMERRVQVLHPVLNIIDLCCMVFFTLENALRIAFIHTRLRYMRSIMGLIDLTALFPDYIHLIMVAIDPTLANSSSTKIITILNISIGATCAGIVDFNLYIESQSQRTFIGDSVSLCWNAYFFVFNLLCRRPENVY
jgi:hypothetical protein